MLAYVFGSALLSSVTLAQIPPQSFNLPTTPNELSLSFQQQKYAVAPGIHYGIGIPVDPVVALTNQEGQSNGTFLIVMIDPDASTPQNPSNAQYLHWLQPGFKFVSEPQNTPVQIASSEDAVADFLRPSPPTYSDPHRYIVYTYLEPQGWALSGNFTRFGSMNRAKFNVASFAATTNLGNPIAANYFYVTNQSYVPSDYVSAPNESYPLPGNATMTVGLPSSTSSISSSTGTRASSSSSVVATVTATSASTTGASTAPAGSSHSATTTTTSSGATQSTGAAHREDLSPASLAAVIMCGFAVLGF